MPEPFDNVLIVTASVGAGHDQAARAIGAEIGARYPGARVTIADFMGEDNSYLNAVLKDAYLKMIDLSPAIYDRLYRWSQAPGRFSRVRSLVSRALKDSMLRLYVRHRPDLVIFTHPFPCAAAAFLRRRGKIAAPLVAVVTDFSAHPLWVHDQVEMYFVAAPETRAELVRLGVAAERVFPTGIPIDGSFGRRLGRHAVARRLGLAAGMPTVLIMGGGLGIGPVAEAVRSLDGVARPLQVVVVAGRNAELRRRLRATARTAVHHIVALGYTRRVRELMAAADVLVTKPGALTVSEALSAGLPMVLASPLPGQEEDNAAFLVDRQAAVLAGEGDDVGSVVAGLLDDPAELERMRERAYRLGHPQAASAAAGIIGRRLDGRMKEKASR
jgi:processive 1,2-diacylglycerol beta-glucosyltransferase